MLLNRSFSLKADIAELGAVKALEIFKMFSHCQQVKIRALFIPFLSYWPVYSDQYGECEDVKYMIQNRLAGLPKVYYYRHKVLGPND